MTGNYTPPSANEIARVAAYWQRVKLLSCLHDSGFTFSVGKGIAECSDCKQPIRFMTDIQLDEHRRQRLDTDLRDNLIRQLDRGGVRFAISGEWHEIRLTAHHDRACRTVDNIFKNAANGEIVHECIGVHINELVLLLRATEA